MSDFPFSRLEPLTMARARPPHRKRHSCGTPAAAWPDPEPGHLDDRTWMTQQKLIEEALDLPQREAARWRHTPLEQEDLVSEGYVGLARAARRFDPSFEVPFAAFARRYVRGAIIDSIRARARRQSLGDGRFADVVGFDDVQAPGGTSLTYEPPDDGPTPHDTLVNLDKLRVIGTLPDRERVALVRTIVDGHTAAEVAVDLGVSPDRVHALVHTGSARLRRRAA
jgi:RNA polymerase sigma factor (sigma-70 family)